MQPQHEPVLVTPLRELLGLQPGQTFLDGTLGLAGHALALLPHILPDGTYVGLDLDPQMIAAAGQRLAAAGFGAACVLRQANYADLGSVLDELGLAGVDAILLDLGVNSAQLDDPARGFSFDRDGPLDMRFDQQQQRQAVDLINALSESELADLFYEYGQETASRKIAKRICQARHTARINSTLALARIIEGLVRGGEVRAGGRLHPATRVFQSLRIAVNAELDNLRRFLAGVTRWLRPGGKLAVISFHSLEDGMVKEFLREARRQGTFAELTKRPVVAEPEERDRNPRSRSAKLRVAQRVAP